MNETVLDPWVATETWVTYHGNTRPELEGQPFKVVQANNRSAGIDAGIYGIQWVAKSSLEVVDTSQLASWERDLYGMTDVDQVFAEAAGGHREMLVNEIARLESRLAELKSALKVIDSL